jgi:exosortase A-associated hydrolase 2
MTGEDRDVAFEPFFLDTDSMHLFCVYFPPVGEARGNYLFVPPFAEEMNRSRSMVAMQSRALANQGYGVLLVDLFGTGDSGGEFGEATWTRWRESVVAASRWLGDRPGRQRGIWGLRLGALLAAELVDEGVIAVDHLVLWQPVANPKSMLTQFLRIKVAAAMDLKVDGPSTDDMRKAFAAGQSVEVGGYELNPELASALDSKNLAKLGNLAQTPTEWLEVSPADEDATLAPASIKAIEALMQRGAKVSQALCHGPLFWQLHERTLAPRLVEVTTEKVLSRHA